MKLLISTRLSMLVFLLMFLLMSAGAFAQVTTTDSVCAGTQDKVYGITSPDANSTYTWYLANAAGTIDSSVTSNNSEIQIDWNSTPGTYTLYAVETTQYGCVGDSVSLDIVINPLPTVTVSIDTACSGYAPNMTLTLTGTAPWTVSYTDGTNSNSVIATSSPFIVPLTAYTSTTNIDITGVTDSHNCDADAAGLPTGTPAVIRPKPSTGAIYHY